MTFLKDDSDGVWIACGICEIDNGVCDHSQLFFVIEWGINRKIPSKKGIKMRRPHVSLLVCVDDLILCCRANKISIQLLLEKLNHFSEVSSLQANMEKSALYIAGVSKEFKEQILEELQFILGDLLFKHLGVPLYSKKLSIQQWMPLVEKITTRINCWTSKFLSYSGRMQLLKSVVFDMQTYWAQVFLLPKKIIKMITTVCGTFLWTGINEPSRRALVAWVTICKPKSAGGLNVLDLHYWNKPALCKLLWAITERKDTLWIQWVHSFYIKNRNVENMSTPKQACWIVKKIFDARDWLRQNNPNETLKTFASQVSSVLRSYTLPQDHNIRSATARD
ncbi:uncharacterized protein LOC107771228 [Nicotiana tabacum]|uniref:Uncharacterized protein LOC107771228 n=1 Tax=Nicotiana tabacum TaxID=4097 RepID=A0A1S3Y1Q3_TOBAC|nr:PREDICTED: uncharacterized protein LOC107771228 [Nicotiana tabacum]